MNHPLDKCGTCERIPRSQIKYADYNPRLPLTADRKRRLKRGLEAHGLLEPLVWNKRTGNLIGGHQRLALLDSLATDKEWMVPVTVHDMDDKQEREANVLLNNQEAQSEYDMSALAALFDSPIKIDVESMGFDLGQVTAFLPTAAAVIPGVAEARAEQTKTWNAERDKAKEKQNAAIDRIIDEPHLGAPRDKAEEKELMADGHFWTTIVDHDFAVAMKRREAWGFDMQDQWLDGRAIPFEHKPSK